MPSDEAYQAVLEALRQIADESRQRAQEASAEIVRYRDSMNRAVLILSGIVSDVEKRLDREDGERRARQNESDRWRLFRLAIDALIIAALAYLIGTRS